MTALRQQLNQYTAGWNQLSVLMRRSIIVILIVLFTQFFLLEPLQLTNQNLLTSIENKKADWLWMKTQLPLIKPQQSVPKLNSTTSVLTRVEASFANLAASSKKLSENKASIVQFEASNVSFDNMMEWLIGLEKQGISLTKADITPVNATPGKVNVKGLLSAS